MIHYVYTTARGLCRTVHAETPVMAWNTARRRHKPAILLNLDGEGWVESATWPGVIRENGAADVTPERARTLYFKACLAEIPIAREEMPRLVADKYTTLGLQRLLAERGLIEHDGPDFRLTDIGLAFAAWIQGGAK